MRNLVRLLGRNFSPAGVGAGPWWQGLCALLPLLFACRVSAAEYTFADGSGAPSCNFVGFIQNNEFEVGAVYGPKCKPSRMPNLNGSGAAFHSPGSSVRLLSFSTNLSTASYLFILNVPQSSWSLYSADGLTNQPFALINSGVLLHGRHDKKSTGWSVFPN